MKKTYFKERTAGSHSGFTLVEMLVVITIIVVLAALSMMGIGRMRDSAYKMTSMKNLSQLQTANVSYATDHNGRFVAIRANDDKGNPTRWFQNPEYIENLAGSILDKSGKQVTTIPLGLMDPKVVRARKSEYDKIYASYGMNDTGLKLGGDPYLDSGNSMELVSDLSRSMAFSTAIDFRVTYNSRFNWKLKDQLDTRQAPGSVGAMAYRHNNKALVVYFDGHVGEISQAEMKAIDGKGGKSNPFWRPTGQ